MVCISFVVGVLNFPVDFLTNFSFPTFPMVDKDIDDLTSYVDAMIGTPYVWWRGGSTLADGAPFWASNTAAPSPESVRAAGCNCAGFINLLCRKRGVLIAGVEDSWYFAGGTGAWAEYIRDWEPFDATASYPAGTLLLRKYRDVEDQGHVAVLWSSGPVLKQRLAHCYIARGIAIDDTVEMSHSWDAGGYYEYVCLPKNWMCPVK